MSYKVSQLGGLEVFINFKHKNIEKFIVIVTSFKCRIFVVHGHLGVFCWFLIAKTTTRKKKIK